jgi:hypothetical protein
MVRLAIFCALILTAGDALAQTGPLSADEQSALLAAIREYALSYTKGLPNYTCTQLIRRTILPTSRRPSGMVANNPQTDTIEEQLSFLDHQEIHKVVKVNGKAGRDVGRNPALDMYSRGEFGNLLEAIFNPETNAAIKWDRFATLNGRRMVVLSFRVPQSKGYSLTEPGRTLLVAYRGLVFADLETKAVMRIEMECMGIPGDSEYNGVNLTLDYKPTQVAGQQFTLPSHYLLHVRKAEGEVISNSDYRAYRRFGAEATITFDSEKQQR